MIKKIVEICPTIGEDSWGKIPLIECMTIAFLIIVAGIITVPVFKMILPAAVLFTIGMTWLMLGIKSSDYRMDTRPCDIWFDDSKKWK